MTGRVATVRAEASEVLGWLKRRRPHESPRLSSAEVPLPVTRSLRKGRQACSGEA